MALKPQDVLVLLKLHLAGQPRPPYARLADDLNMSVSEVHAAVKRARQSRLVFDLNGELRIVRQALLEFLVHGLKYAFPAKRGEPTRGFPTGYASAPLNKRIVQPNEPPPVWPHPEGEVRGYEFDPLCKQAVEAARKDQALYEMLALIDAVRGGQARERNLAAEELERRLYGKAVAAAGVS